MGVVQKKSVANTERDTNRINSDLRNSKLIIICTGIAIPLIWVLTLIGILKGWFNKN